MELAIFTMELQDVSGSRTAMELVYVLSDDGNLAPLLAESLLRLSDGQVSRVGILCEHDLTAIVIKLPDTRRIPREGLWCG